MRSDCDFVSAVCGDPTVTHSIDVAGQTKYVCQRHATILERHPSTVQPPVNVAVPPMRGAILCDDPVRHGLAGLPTRGRVLNCLLCYGPIFRHEEVAEMLDLRQVQA